MFVSQKGKKRKKLNCFSFENVVAEYKKYNQMNKQRNNTL